MVLKIATCLFCFFLHQTLGNTGFFKSNEKKRRNRLTPFRNQEYLCMAKKVRILSEPVGAGRRTALKGVVPLPTPGAGTAAFLEAGTHAAAKQIRPAATELLYSQLVFALWLLVSKTKLRHRQIGSFLSRLAKQYPSLPTRRELDLWIRMLLCVLFKYGYLPSADIKYFRHDAAPLHDVTHLQLKKIADDFEILRALQKEFGPKKKELKPEQVILDLMLALHRRLEEFPAAVTDAARSEFRVIHELVRQAGPRVNSAGNPAGLLTRSASRANQTKAGRVPAKKN